MVIIIDALIKLVEPERQDTEVLATVQSVSMHERGDARQYGYKNAYRFIVYAEEYGEQSEVEYMGEVLSIYRTFMRPDGRTELYAEEKAGERGGN
jgi:hypothetical protein